MERIMFVGQAWACNVSFRVIMLFEYRKQNEEKLKHNITPVVKSIRAKLNIFHDFHSVQCMKRNK